MDLALVETLNGGDLVKSGNDLLLIDGWGNMIYLSMFGGNIDAVTQPRQPGHQAFDWWGNETLMSGNISNQFNSLTESALKNTPLTSAGRSIIQQAVEKDVEFMKDFADIVVTVLIISTFEVQIIIKVTPLKYSSSAYQTYNFIWNGETKLLSGDFSIFDFNDDFYK
jgi:hypothetical protein